MIRTHLTRTRLGVVMAVAAGASLGAVFGQPGTGQAASTAVPTNKTLPIISGVAAVGDTLRATRGTWSGHPSSFHFQWSRCDTSGNACAAIGGATGRIYNLNAADFAHTLRVTVTARNRSGAGRATSAPTAIVAPSGCPPGTGTIPIAELSPPARLVIGNDSISPSVTRSTKTIRVHFVITACGGRPVQGAVVAATAIPYNQFAPAAVTTAADGAVTITETRQRGFPASTHQRLLAVFAHATKPGDPALGGVSASRVVAFHVSLH